MAAVMTEQEKTHYRAAMKTVYLASEDVTDPVTLTIARAVLERDLTKRSKESFNTAYFKERELRPGQPLKPMIINAANCKTLHKLTGSPFLQDWEGVAITVYCDPTVKFGHETVGGLRISPEKPRLEKPKFNASNKTVFDRAVSAYQRDGNCDSIAKHMTLTDADRLAIEATAKERGDA